MTVMPSRGSSQIQLNIQAFKTMTVLICHESNSAHTGEVTEVLSERIHVAIHVNDTSHSYGSYPLPR